LPKKKTAKDAKLLSFVMPDGKMLGDCGQAEIEVMKRWHADQATIDDLNAAGPSTAKLAFQIAIEVIRAQDGSAR
jgi:hypothetical protein